MTHLTKRLSETGESRLFILIPLAGITAIALLAGVFLGMHQRFPYQWVRDAELAAKALFDPSRHLASRVQSDLWEKATSDARGVVRHDPGKAFEGYTLYTSGHAQKAFLVDMAGTVVHEWALPFDKVDTTGRYPEARPEYTYYRDAYLYPNGDLLVIYVAFGMTPWGMGLVKLDKDSNLIWAFLEPVHHDLSVGEDGKIYTLTHRIRRDLPEVFQHLKGPIIDDSVVVLNPDGHKLKEVNILDALARSNLQGFIEEVAEKKPGPKGDLLHTNTVEVLPSTLAPKFPFLKPGEVLLSFRKRDAIATVDLETGRMTWVLRGEWRRQHDPDFLPNGHILLFDNSGWLGEGGRSQVLEIDPMNEAVVWRYTGDRDHPMYSWARSRQQRLPNGNTLITVSAEGRLLEVTPNGDIVWEFVNPVREQFQGEAYIPVVSAGYRYAPGHLKFLTSAD